MREYFQMHVIVPRGDEVAAAREIWAQATAAERDLLAKLAGELLLLREATGEQRILIAPAAVLEAAGLPKV